MLCRSSSIGSILRLATLATCAVSLAALEGSVNIRIADGSDIDGGKGAASGMRGKPLIDSPPPAVCVCVCCLQSE